MKFNRHIHAALTIGLLSIFLGGANPVIAQEKPKQARTVLLDQGWSKADRLKYYFTSQGSAIRPYDLFVNLEEAKGEDLLRSDRISAAFGLIPEAVDAKYNPDGLPIGITKTKVAGGRFKGEWVGLTCAMCHNAQLNYKGTAIRIEGGVNNRMDFTGYVGALDAALAATVASPEKFERLAKRMNRGEAAAKAELRKLLVVTAGEVHYYGTRSVVTPFPVGPGRMDALGAIHNRVMSFLGIPENWAANLAPTKPPFMWNAPQSAWVQWSGRAADVLERNATESLGVFVRIDLAPETPAEGKFDSTLDLW